MAGNPELQSKLRQPSLIIDNFLRLNQTPQPSHVIIALGNNDNRTAFYAGQLFSQDLAPWLLLTGGVGTRTLYPDISESRRFLKIIQRNFPDLDYSRIILEENAENTGQNVSFSRQTLESLDILPSSLLLVTKPFAERRVLATFTRQWPEITRITVVSPNYPFDNYFIDPEVNPVYLAKQLWGEIDHLHRYPQQGFIDPQNIPPPVDRAAKKLEKLLAGPPSARSTLPSPQPSP